MRDFLTVFNLVVKIILLGAGIDWLGVMGAPVKNETMQCTVTSDMVPAIEKVFAACKEELKPSNLPDFHAPIEEIEKYYDNVAKNDFNDKCFAKCLMEKLNMLTPVGNADIKVVEKLYQGGNMTETFRKTVVKEWITCNLKVEKDFPGGGETPKICKKAAKLEHCLFSKAGEMEIPC